MILISEKLVGISTPGDFVAFSPRGQRKSRRSVVICHRDIVRRRFSAAILVASRRATPRRPIDHRAAAFGRRVGDKSPAISRLRIMSKFTNDTTGGGGLDRSNAKAHPSVGCSTLPSTDESIKFSCVNGICRSSVLSPCLRSLTSSFPRKLQRFQSIQQRH